MKHFKKTLFILALTSMLCGCSKSGGYTYPEFGPLPEGKSYDVGILLPLEHGALRSAVNGFKQGLEENGWIAGKNINFVERNADNKDDLLRTAAIDLNNKCILNLGVGTGAAVQLKSAEYNKGNKNPILFTAVTDPVDASLVNSMDKPGGYVTGTCDAQPVEAQIDLILECIPTIQKIGIFYTITETNSAVQAIQAKSAIESKGLTAVIKTCQNSTDIDSAFTSLVNTSGIGAIYIPTDNNVAGNMQILKNCLQNKGILLVCGEENMLTNGGQITLSINYTDLGRRTGEMAAKILSGEKKPEEMSVVAMNKEDCEYVMSSSNLSFAKVNLPDTVKNKCRDIDK